jgi:hypothetical protein
MAMAFLALPARNSARLSVPALECDRCLLVGDSEEDMTQILTVLCERTSLALGTSQEVQTCAG